VINSSIEELTNYDLLFSGEASSGTLTLSKSIFNYRQILIGFLPNTQVKGIYGITLNNTYFRGGINFLSTNTIMVGAFNGTITADGLSINLSGSYYRAMGGTENVAFPIVGIYGFNRR